MKSQPAELRVQHIEAWRFHVASQTKGKPPYLVDLDCLDGNGQCDCEFFTFTLMPVLMRGINTDFSRCKHIEAAMNFALDPFRLRDYVLVGLLRHGFSKLEVKADQPFTVPAVIIPKVKK